LKIIKTGIRLYGRMPLPLRTNVYWVFTLFWCLC